MSKKLEELFNLPEFVNADSTPEESMESINEHKEMIKEVDGDGDGGGVTGSEGAAGG